MYVCMYVCMYVTYVCIPGAQATRAIAYCHVLIGVDDEQPGGQIKSSGLHMTSLNTRAYAKASKYVSGRRRRATKGSSTASTRLAGQSRDGETDVRGFSALSPSLSVALASAASRRQVSSQDAAMVPGPGHEALAAVPGTTQGRKKGRSVRKCSTTGRTVENVQAEHEDRLGYPLSSRFSSLSFIVRIWISIVTSIASKT